MITVLMSTYRESAEQLKQSIESILNQTYSNFTFIIIVDNPNQTENIETIKKYAEKDKRIKYYINERNIGLAESLNEGIDLASTRYIARMDADDISLPNRFETQIAFLEANPDVDMIGSYCSCIDESGNCLYDITNCPCDSKSLKKYIKYINLFVHPTYFGKAALFKELKYRDLRYAQDYDFICRAMEQNKVIKNIPFILLQYRVYSNIDISKNLKQSITCFFIQKYYNKKELSKSDIKTIIDNELSIININKEEKAVCKYRMASYYFHQKKYLKCFFSLANAFFISKYERKYIINVVTFYLTNKKHKYES